MTVSPLRIVIAVLLALAMAYGAVQLARVDATLGAPKGADRLLASVDAEPAVPAADADTARAMLHARPIDGRAHRVLGQVADAGGDTAAAAEHYTRAVQRAPRDRIARAQLAERAFAKGDIAIGLEHLDVLMRVAPSVRGDALALLAPNFANPTLQQALIVRLVQDPPWRTALPAVLQADATPKAGAADLLAALAERSPLTTAETEARIAVLRQLGRAGEGRQAWLAALPAEASGADKAFVFDGGFEQPEVTGGYAWRLNPPPGVGIGHDPVAPVAGSQSLAITFESRDITGIGLEQWLALPPGLYRLDSRAENGTDSPRPFEWQIACQDDGRVLATSPLPPNGPALAWADVGSDFGVPMDCPAQVLRLVQRGRSLAERRYSGVLRLDDVRITRL